MMLRTYKKAPDDVFCPIVNGSKRFFRRPMSKTCPTCPFWTAITGQPTTSHEAVDLGWVCSEQGQFQSQVDIARRLMGRESAVESERNMLVHAFNQQAAVQDAMVQKLGNLAEATHQVAIAMDTQLPLLTSPQPKMIGNGHADP